MAKLFLLRHFKSRWNEENRFTGWVDVPLLPGWEDQAKKTSKKIFKENISIVYTSPLTRNKESVLGVFDYYNKKYPIFIHLDKGKMKKQGHFKEINKRYLPVYVTEGLNERYYGKLQGEDKRKMMQKYGKEQVHLWRRGFKNRPPGGENLRKTFKRILPVYKHVKKNLREGKNVLIVASHNSLRALVKYIEKIPNKEIDKVEIAYGGLIKYQFDKKLKLKKKETIKVAKK